MSTQDIHDKERELNLNNKTFQNSEHVSRKDKLAVQDFCDKCKARRLSDARVSKYVTNFHTISKLAPDNFDLLGATKKELETVVARIEATDYSEATKCDFKMALKKFYKLTEGDPDGDEYPEKVGFFSVQRDKKKIDDPNPLEEEAVMDIIEACKNDRDRAMYKVLYEAGLRAGELMSLKVEDVKFVSKGVKIHVDGKTGERNPLMVESERYLRTWLSKHPFPDRPKAPLWTKIRQIDGKTPEEVALGYDHMRLNLKEIAIRAGVRTYQKGWKKDKDDNYKKDEKGNKIPNMKTDVYPHLFRHTRATHLATELTESAMKKYFGWSRDSDMPSVYVHLSGRDIDNEIAQLYGLDLEEDKVEEKECPRCFQTYKGSENYCPKCGVPFNSASAVNLSEVKEASEKVAEERIAGMKEEDIMERLKLLEEEIHSSS